MRPTFVQLGAVGYTPWVPVDRMQLAFAVSCAVTLSSGAVLTYTLQHTFDDSVTEQSRPVSVVQSASTTATITDAGPPGNIDNGHGLSTGDSVTLDSTQTGIDGTYGSVTVVSATQYTVVTTINQTATATFAKAKTFRAFPNASLAAQTARGAASYGYPISAVRLNITAWTSGTATLVVVQGQPR